uniref:EF-hand domain family member D2 n=1 Tax=Spermophilus dauricus TaxID=99837 RepID=A0A8C9URK7_SPEDA
MVRARLSLAHTLWCVRSCSRHTQHRHCGHVVTASSQPGLTNSAVCWAWWCLPMWTGQSHSNPDPESRPSGLPSHPFKEFSRKQIKDMERMFKQYDAGRDGFIDLMELKLMMEKLGAPQTHLGLKNMIKEVDEDLDSKLSFREFLLIFRKAAAGELQESGLHVLARLSEIDVSTEGVKGAKSFFEAKVQAINVSSRFEEEIKAEQEERKKQAEEMKQRKAAFKELQSTFK